MNRQPACCSVTRDNSGRIVILYIADWGPQPRPRCTVITAASASALRLRAGDRQTRRPTRVRRDLISRTDARDDAVSADMSEPGLAHGGGGHTTIWEGAKRPTNQRGRHNNNKCSSRCLACRVQIWYCNGGGGDSDQRAR
jgi:hypothetical protein